MSRIRELVSRQGADSALEGVGANMWHAEIAAPAPADVNDPLYVNIPDISYQGEVKFGPCLWNSQLYGLTGMTLPQEGDAVLVAFDNRQQPWVVAIWQ